jgi:hypothetical protein
VTTPLMAELSGLWSLVSGLWFGLQSSLKTKD